MSSGPAPTDDARLIILDLKHNEAAMKVGKQLADQTGRTVTVTDADGAILAVFEPAPRQ
jgi:hypothetical protein